MVFTSGYDWLDLIYILTVTAGTGFYIFRPWKEKTKEEIKAGKKIIRYYTTKSGRMGYKTQSSQDFEFKYWVFSFLLLFFILIVPSLLYALNLLQLR